MFKTIKKQYSNHPVFKRSSLIFACIIFLLLLIRVSLSPAIIYSTISWLKKQGIEAEINDIKIDLFNGSIALINASGQKNNEPVFKIDNIKVQWKWSPLTDNIIDISAIKISGISATIQHYTDALVVSSINIPLGKPVTEKKDKGSKTNWAVLLQKIMLADFNICYSRYNSPYNKTKPDSPQLDYCMQLGKLAWDGPVQYSMGATPNNKQSSDFSVSGKLLITDSRIHNQKINRDLIDLKSLLLSGIDISGSDKLSLNTISIQQLELLQTDKSPNKNYTLGINKLDIENTRLSDNHLFIHHININGLSASLAKNKSGHWEYEKWLIKNNENKKLAEKQTHKAFSITLNSLTINTDKPVAFIDNSTDPVMKIALSELSIKADNIDSTKPDSQSHLMLSATTSQHANITIEGSAQVFSEKLSFDGKGKIRGLDLRPLTPVTRKTIGHIIKSGQLNADLKLQARHNILDSDIKLSLYHFNLQAISKEDAKKLNDSFGMPLNQALALLRDKDDSIHLNIPITGDINKPDFDPMDAIIKATSKATTVALITFYTPYGLIYTGGNLLFDLATALNFDPITFTPGSSDLQQNNKQQLDKLAKLMTEKPGIHLTLCGISNQDDKDFLFPEFDKNKDSRDNESKNLTKPQILSLKKLADQRQINAKNYLVNKKAIPAERLILCVPEYKKDNDISGVEISI